MSEGEEGLVGIVDRARTAFTNNEFTKAVDLYSQALSTDPSNVELLVCRAHAHTKGGYLDGEIRVPRVSHLQRVMLCC